jgi:hypothetical protein
VWLLLWLLLCLLAVALLLLLLLLLLLFTAVWQPLNLLLLLLLYPRRLRHCRLHACWCAVAAATHKAQVELWVQGYADEVQQHS